MTKYLFLVEFLVVKEQGIHSYFSEVAVDTLKTLMNEVSSSARRRFSFSQQARIFKVMLALLVVPREKYSVFLFLGRNFRENL